MVVHEFKIFDFQAEKKKRTEQKEFNARYEYIKSKCQIGNVELFDSLIDEVTVTEDSSRSLADFIKSCQNLGLEPTLLFEESILLHDEEDYHDITGVNWWIAVEEALTFYSMLKDKDPYTYKSTVNQIFCPD